MLGSVVNGLAAYAFVALGTRTYGAGAFAPVSVLWTFWALSVAVFTFPIQHWIIRIVEVDGDEASVSRALPGLVAATFVVSAALGVVALIWRSRLFGSPSWLWPALVVAVGVGSAVVGFLRGVLAGRKRFIATGAAIGSENLLRLGAGIAVVTTGATVGWFAACLVAGPLIATAWPGVFRLRGGTPKAEHRLAELLGGIAGGALMAQIALNAGPAVLAGIGGPPEDVTGFFATLALFRAPYLVALGLATLLTGRLTALVIAGNEAKLRRLRTRFALATVVGTAASGALAAIIGPSVVDLVFGAGVAPSAGVVAAISAGSALALAALIALLMLVARGAARAIPRAWAWGLGAGLLVLLSYPAEPLPTVAAAFVITEVVALTLMVVTDARAGGGAVSIRRP